MAAATSLLDSLTADSRQHLLDRSTVRRLDDDEYLFHHGDVADCMYVVESGRLAVQTTTSDGDTAIVRVIGPGQVVGELALLVDGLRRTGSVVALGTVRRSASSTARCSASFGTRDPGVDRALVADLAARLAALSEQFVVNQFGTLADRVLERLLVLDEVYRHGWIEINQEELGAMVGGSRQAVNRALADAAAAGLIADPPRRRARPRPCHPGRLPPFLTERRERSTGSTVPTMRNRGHASVLLTFGLVLGLLAMGYGALFSMLDDIRDEYGVGESALGAVIGIGFLAGFVSQILIAPLRRPGHARLPRLRRRSPSTSPACCCSPRPRRSCRCSPAAS